MSDTVETGQPYALAEGTDSVRPLIYATWLRSYEQNSPHAKNIPRDAFFAGHHRVLDKIMERRPLVLCAVLPDDPDVVLGYAVTEPEKALVHYVYVKPAFRRYGIARRLLEGSGITHKFTHTHYTFVLRQLWPQLKECTFDPYEVFTA